MEHGGGWSESLRGRTSTESIDSKMHLFPLFASHLVTSAAPSRWNVSNGMSRIFRACQTKRISLSLSLSIYLLLFLFLWWPPLTWKEKKRRRRRRRRRRGGKWGGGNQRRETRKPFQIAGRSAPIYTSAFFLPAFFFETIAGIYLNIFIRFSGIKGW